MTTGIGDRAPENCPPFFVRKVLVRSGPQCVCQIRGGLRGFYLQCLSVVYPYAIHCDVMAEFSPENIVEDWGGFEKLVAKLHETGTVTVEHNVTLTGQSGAPRQIDVLVRHTEGLYEHLILVECKHWKSNVKRIQIDALATAVRDLKASKGVIFTTKGFQSGAVRMAEAVGVDLIKVRGFTDTEWGSPGRHVDFNIQYFQRSIGSPDITAAVQAIPGVERT